ncbi:MAG: ABC transporter ATP-binding protein [Actinobacteria bacterium]|nr:ABC transporter ATP-binding protein [Actinomycetota bacterium]
MSADATTNGAILQARGMRRAFGGLVAVDVESFSVMRGSITALIGPNGAGKTTLFNVLTGFERADHGEWTFDDRDVSGWPAYRIARAGMVRTFQIPKALARMSVLENMKLAAQTQRGEGFFPALLRRLWCDEEARIEARGVELLEWVGLAKQRDDYAGTLSGGQRKLLELGRALMTNPRLVMLDEPTAGVNPALTEQLLDRIRSVRDEGATVLFVEHDMDVVGSISDRVICMAQGSVIAEGTAAEVVADPQVIDAYLGERHGEAAMPTSEGPT